MQISGRGPIPVGFYVKNAGLNIAQEITAFATLDGKKTGKQEYKAVLEVHAKTVRWQVDLESDGSGKKYELVCRYRNLWGDEYEITTPLTQKMPGKQYTLGRERFRVVKATD